MVLETCMEKEEALLSAKEKVGEAVEALEEVLPDAAEELIWIQENLARELREFRAQMSQSASAGELI